MGIRVFLVEDDAAISEMLCFSLRHSGFDCRSFDNGELALSSLEAERPDIILLDWMLPGIDGIEFIRRLRGSSLFSAIPVIMLTAKGESEDLVKGLTVGADDYVNKPFSPPELIARIKAVLRRCNIKADDQDEEIEISGIKLDLKSHRVVIEDKKIDFGPTEFRLLHFFMTHPSRVYSRGQLLDYVWGDNVYIEERTVDVHIRRLRKALELKKRDHLIQTVRGVGYLFEEES